MTEQVLVIPSKLYTPDVSFNQLKEIIAAHSLFMDRPIAETDPNYLQIIPYIVVFKGPLVFCYQRLKKGTETRLHSKYSIGIGGHVNSEDKVPDLSNWAAVETAAYRELEDELFFDTSSGHVINWKGQLIYDPSNEVGKVHLGILGTCDLTHHHIEIGEPDKIEGTFVFIEKAKSLMYNMETWSSIAMEHIQ